MISSVLVAILSLPALLAIVWSSEVCAGCFALRKFQNSPAVVPDAPPCRTTVLIPAHDEGTAMLPTLRDVQAQLGPRDGILVVADNCTDDTAAVASASGVEVVVRVDDARRGKGYALEYGIRHLADNPPDVVIIVDSDCRLGENALRHLSANAMASGRPVQSLYLMQPPEAAAANIGVSLFAWRVKNWIRPLGMKLFGLPTQLVGTGMAFPFGLLAGRDLGNSRLAEDCALGIALASAGHPPLFVSEAEVYSTFPVSQAGSASQRQRWERGHLENIVDLVPGALVKSLSTGSLGLAALATDMAVPPLSLLVLVSAGCVMIGGIASMLGATPLALALPLGSLLLVAIGTVFAWRAVGRDVLPGRELLRLPLHVLRKLGFYHGIASGKASSSWIRTDRK